MNVVGGVVAVASGVFRFGQEGGEGGCRGCG